MLSLAAVFIIIIIITLGQLLRYYSKRSRVFYLSHALGFLAVILYSILVTSNQSGGVNWPWWFFGILYSVPIFISLFIGVVQDLIRK